jgi:hypothetical protein
MVAKITMPQNVIAALNYNENKLKQGKAQCIYAAGYLRSAEDMNFYQKLNGFDRLNCLNERATTKTIHVSLNFDPSENLNSDRLITIASEYMQGIGFGQQPYLIYKHFDAAHPHIHIVSTTIREDGSRINTHNIGRNQSEKARKEVEAKYGLIKAEDQKRVLRQKIQPINPEKVIYGKVETRKSIALVVSAVFNAYKYSSLPEFNAILKQFNVLADRGSENGRIYKNRGLVYRVLDAEGNKVGVPIKASDINSKPTLNKLEIQFSINESLKEPLKNLLKNKVDEVLSTNPDTLRDLMDALQRRNVYTVIRNNSEGKVYGITFVDNNCKSVFNGSDLGMTYSVGNLQRQILSSNANKEVNTNTQTNTPDNKQPKYPITLAKHEQTEKSKSIDILDALISPEKQFEGVPFQLLKKKRKRKRQSPDL